MLTNVTGSRKVHTVWPLHLWVAIGLFGAFGLALVGTSLGALPRPDMPSWWFNVSMGNAAITHIAFYLSIALMLVGWGGVGLHAYAGRLSVPKAWCILAMWGLPLYLGPPLFSRDIYSYIGQGQLARHGLNPYVVPASHLGNGVMLSSIAPVWRDTISPYGPLFVSLSRVAADTGSSLVSQVLVFRALELLGVCLLACALPPLARSMGTDPGIAMWLGVLSPLALFSFISSGHNDALMVGLMVAGVALARTGRLAWGVALCAIAASIKLPAAASIVFIAADQLRSASGPQRRRVVVTAIAIPCLVIGAVTVATGLGWEWLGPTSLHVPAKIRVLTTPTVAIGNFVHAVIHVLGVPVSLTVTVSVFEVLGGLVGVAGTLWLVYRAREHDAVRLLGLALVLIVVSSPIVWPWYLSWGVAILAATSAQRSKLLAAVAAFSMLAVGPGGTPMLGGDTYFLTAPLVLGAIGWFVWDRQWRLAPLRTGLAS